ncbi:hypothetical protein BN1723_014534 [Verticillium longisporum]|uniref:DUF1446 domain-containing protein n=1 Tax=Verticillium longisporum TaxID=100787 RepID=A0A0G4MCD0_VERLO|nr:hypothetical protein BN1723_014534 [Verticillium longisporum]
MAASVTPQRPVRVGGASGGFTDRVAGIRRLAADPEVDAVVGDWLSENVMTGYGAGKARKVQSDKATTKLPLEERKKTAYYASTFLQCFEPAIPEIARNGTELVVNAGASDKELLAEVVDDMVLRGGFDMKVARVEGDDVTLSFKRLVAEGATFRSVTDERTLNEWGFDPICAQAYLGSLGIAEALRQGADIVICGRVSDAAPSIGIATWWHNWGASDLDELAGALVAGHLIECSVFVTGGYYSRFKDLMKAKKHLDLGFPIAEVFSDGTCSITKEEMSNGIVNVETVTSQLIYEINGPLYFNSDVVAVLEGIALEQIGKDRVRVCGVKGPLPPPTTRCGITAHGGYQAEWHFYLVGLDIEEKSPLGYIALGRSGDKASDANVGLFVSGVEEWDWLRSFLTVNKVQELLGPEEYHGGRIDRFEMKNIRAVHFLLKDHLDRGYNSGSKLDTLAKILCEYLRAKHVPIPRKFLQKGHL